MSELCSICNGQGWTWETFPRKAFLSEGQQPLHAGKLFKTKCERCGGGNNVFSISDILIERGLT